MRGMDRFHPSGNESVKIRHIQNFTTTVKQDMLVVNAYLSSLCFSGGSLERTLAADKVRGSQQREVRQQGQRLRIPRDQPRRKRVGEENGDDGASRRRMIATS
ncbi:hypothetical protein ACFX2I_022224 [Malus domestica]